mgnify:CR=1 FL=1
MSWEYIAEHFSGQWPEDSKWIEFQVKIAISYLKLICGDPPLGCKLDLTMREHELGDYPIIGLWWGDPPYNDYLPPMDYVVKCQNVCSVFCDSVNWADINPVIVKERYCNENEKSEED